jgi:hypothetical protein
MATNSTNFGMPKQQLQPLPPGATSIRDSGIVTQNMNSKLQNTLINGKTGGSKKHYLKGGASSILVQPVPVNGLNNTQTQQNYTNLTQAAAVQNRQAAYDGLVGQNQSATAVVAAQQSAISGGRAKRKSRRKTLRGGWPKWGCLSGGRRKSRKNRRTKINRKSRHHK